MIIILFINLIKFRPVKTFQIILFICLHHKLYAGEIKNRLCVDVGKSASLFLRDQNKTFPIYQNNFIPNSLQISLSLSKSFYSAQIRYFSTSEMSSKENLKNGDILSRTYFSYDVNYGRIFRTNKYNFQYVPMISIGYKSGSESIVLGTLNPWHNYSKQDFIYGSPGFGFGINLRKTYINFLTFSIDAHYNYNFEHKNPSPDYGNYSETVNNHKISRSICTMGFKLGIGFNWKRKKSNKH